MSTSAFDPMFETLKTIAVEANELSSKIRSASTSDKDAVEEVLNTSTDPTVAKWRDSHAKVLAQIAEAEAKLKERREAIVAHARTILPNADFDVEESKKEFLQKRAEATALKNALLTMLKGDKDAFQAKVDEFGITEVLGIRANSTRVGATGVRRPRLAEAYIGDKRIQNGEGKVSFSTLVKEIPGGKVQALKDAAFAAAGTDDFSTIPGQVIEFVYTVKDNSYSVTVVTQDKSDESEGDAEVEESEVSEEAAA